MKKNKFWQWFVQNEKRLLRLDPDQITEEVYAQLEAFISPVVVEVAAEGTPRELIISACGVAESFSIVKQFVAAAPSMPEWQFIALKPPRGFDFKMNIGGCEVDGNALRFDPLTPKEGPPRLGIQVFGPADIAGEEELDSILITIVEAGIGEEVAAAIEHLAYADIATCPKEALFMHELGEYVDWFWRKHS
jgi:hypothetical protein